MWNLQNLLFNLGRENVHTAKDMVQVAYGYGLFTGGLGAHYGAERLGATVFIERPSITA